MIQAVSAHQETRCLVVSMLRMERRHAGIARVVLLAPAVHALVEGGELQYLQRGNPFETPFLAVIALIAVLHYPAFFLGSIAAAFKALQSMVQARRAARRRCLLVLKLLAVVSFIGFCVSERYYRYGQCATSKFYNEQNVQIYKTVAQTLTEAGAMWYLDRGSLIACLRNQKLLPWDPDSDVGVLLPPGREEATIDRIRSALESTRLPGARGAGDMVTYADPRRDLLQVYPDASVSANKAPHIDLWFHRRYEREGEVFWQHKDDDTHYQHRAERSLLPFRYRDWMGVNTSIPAGAHDITRIEFGDSYMTPIIFRAECVHNAVNGRSWY